MTQVVHCKREPYDVYIGRDMPGLPASKWENPFKIGYDGSREDVIAKFREYLINNDELMASLHELKGKTLGCWCVPLACHGDVLVELIDKRR